MRSLILACAALLSACTTAPTQHLHTAGEVVCDHRVEIRQVVEAAGQPTSWLDSLDWLCALLGLGE